ncbi:MAG: hypothetical protein DRP58_07440 [Spirochaetes bacterium]|nr:MAG: hypothetical protein DRP58_07440 [Spirochaetota bacterium]
MISDKNKKRLYSDDIWIISEGKYSDIDLDGICAETNAKMVKEYRISDLARYLLSPNSIEIKKKLVGCEVYYPQSFFNNIKEKIKRLLPKKLHGLLPDRKTPPEVLISQDKEVRPPLDNKNLELHLNKIDELLRPFDLILKRLKKLDIDRVSDIRGICEDIGGNRTGLTLHGSIDKKIDYLNNCLLKEVGVILEKTFIPDGLFELSGFDFKSFNPKNSYKLIKFLHGNVYKICILDFNNKVEYWLDDIKLVKYMHLLEQSIQSNPGLKKAFNLCIKGDAKPLKLFFKKQLEIDYSKENFPRIYRDVFETYNLDLKARDEVLNSLNHLQFGIAFHYVLPKSNTGEEKLLTNISVMHDFRALESIKDNLPQLYSEIDKRASVSEAGKYYLLDSMRGYRNE